MGVESGSQGIFYSDLHLKYENLNSKVKTSLAFILNREVRCKEQSDALVLGFLTVPFHIWKVERLENWK